MPASSIARRQPVLGTTTAHSRTCDGSIPSAATAPQPGCGNFSGCSSGVELVAWNDEAAGAIPVTQTERFLDVAQKESAWSGTTRPLVRFQPSRPSPPTQGSGHKTTNLVGWGSNPLG